MSEIQRASSRTGQTSGTIDNPKCTCCTPPTYLEPPSEANPYWVCPMTGKEYSYDPGEGIAREVAGSAATANQRVNPRRESNEEDDLIPHNPDRNEHRQVDPTRDKFA